MKIWIDVTNTPHVNVLMPVIRHLEKKHELIISARDFSETLPLLRQNGIEPVILGAHKGKSRIHKAIGLVGRLYDLYRKIPYFDLSLSLGGNYTATISKFRRKPSIVLSDNDISFKTPAYRFGSYFIFPSYFKTDLLQKKYGVKPEQVFKFDGFKEDIYIAAYKPDPEFMKQLPFHDFITIRPENLKASYVPQDSRTIVPQLFEIFKNENILYLPRYTEEREYAKGYKNIFMPEAPLKGLDVCYYTKAMLTGAGTFAREAALLGTPAVSFFPGKAFLTVDVIMQENGWEFKSRVPEDIFHYVAGAQKHSSQQDRSKQVFNEVIGIIETIIAKHEKV
jgi:predicted glycosyltransferase